VVEKFLSARRPVVLLHGVAMSVAFFERNVSDLAHDHRVIALDFRGHGYRRMSTADTPSLSTPATSAR